MMKLVILYRQPEDPAAFTRHYEEVHLPLARQVPGLRRIVINRVAPSRNGPDCFLITEMHFADRATLDAALASPENRAAGADLANFAAGKVDFMIVEATEEVFD